MARLHGKDLSVLNVDDSGGTPVNLLAETISIGEEVGVDTHDTTTLGDDWHEFTAGLKGGNEFPHELFYTDGAAGTGTYLTLAARLGVAGTLTIGDGTRSVAMETIITKVSSPTNVGDMKKVTVSHKITGAVTYS
jgi:hypothetical protein